MRRVLRLRAWACRPAAGGVGAGRGGLLLVRIRTLALVADSSMAQPKVYPITLVVENNFMRFLQFPTL